MKLSPLQKTALWTLVSFITVVAVTLLVVAMISDAPGVCLEASCR